MSTHLQLLTDFYELTMSGIYYNKEYRDKWVIFDVFFRSNPFKGGYVIASGQQDIINYLINLKFEVEDIEYLRSQNIFDDDFLNYLNDFKFNGDMYCIKEGTPVFPYEPVISIKAPIIEGQIVESFLLNAFNSSSLFSTKARRITNIAKNTNATIIEMGLRRAQGIDSSIKGARNAYINGFLATSNIEAGRIHNIPLTGTMAHSFVTFFDSEEEAFDIYVNKYPNNAILLVDTFNTLKSGVPNAIKIFKKYKKLGRLKKYGIRLDSGDLSYLAKESRKLLDAAGLHDALIIASSDLNETLIQSLQYQKAPIDAYGIGTQYITSYDCPALGGVYKLAGVIHEDNIIENKIKISDNIIKVTTPGFKQVYRFIDKDTKKALADVITFRDEVIDDQKPYELFDPQEIWKKKTISNFEAIPLLNKVIEKGKLIVEESTIEDIKNYSNEQFNSLYTEVTRLTNPHKYYVDLSLKLYNEKQRLLKENM